MEAYHLKKSIPTVADSGGSLSLNFDSWFECVDSSSSCGAAPALSFLCYYTLIKDFHKMRVNI